MRPRRPPATAFLLVPGTRRLSLPVLVGEGAAPPRDCVSLGAGEASVRCILLYLIVFNIRFLVLELSRPRHLAFASGVDTMGAFVYVARRSPRSVHTRRVGTDVSLFLSENPRDLSATTLRPCGGAPVRPHVVAAGACAEPAHRDRAPVGPSARGSGLLTLQVAARPLFAVQRVRGPRAWHWRDG